MGIKWFIELLVRDEPSMALKRKQEVVKDFVKRFKANNPERYHILMEPYKKPKKTLTGHRVKGKRTQMRGSY